MERSFRASIVGLGCSDVVSIRQHIHDVLADGGDVSWVPANQENLDFLVINSCFISSSSIQSLIRKNALPVLLVNHSPKNEEIEQNIISLPLFENSRLKNWVQEFVIDKKRAAISQAAPQSVDQNPAVIESTNLLKGFVSKAQGLYHLSDTRGAIGVVDTISGLMWLVPERSTSIDMTGSLKSEVVSQIPRQHRSVDLMQWLWEVIWSASSCATLVPLEQLIEIKIWPQPFRKSDRKDMLILSASLAQGTSSAHQLALDTKIPLSRVQHFVSALVTSGFAERVDRMPEVTPQAHQVERAVVAAEQTVIRRLLSGLRNRLGL
ncbi:hypothetical protein [Aquirhabdus parva]|uniref:Uncharacterized protein n=1 Tax=Aquirhabdus parva TaxID=2283318 RepID=A0A345PAI8_9GAMM|nr:hypothetical protein [Aquirhabdus parva]AXI04297.1 hypothetical protein HYN46_16515 [Aquirhabdus parva]